MSRGEPMAAASPYWGGICCVEQQRRRELSEPEQECDASAVDERGPEQRQHDAEEDAGTRRAVDVAGLEQLVADVLESRGDEQIDERREREAGDDDDPGQRVDVERAVEAAAPPRQVTQELVQVARPRREQEGPAEHAGERREHDREDRHRAQQPEPARERRRGPREPRPEHDRDQERADAEEDRVLDGRPFTRPRVRVPVRPGAVLQREVLQPREREDRQVADGAEEGQQADARPEAAERDAPVPLLKRDGLGRHVSWRPRRGGLLS